MKLIQKNTKKGLATKLILSNIYNLLHEKKISKDETHTEKHKKGTCYEAYFERRIQLATQEKNKQ